MFISLGERQFRKERRCNQRKQLALLRVLAPDTLMRGDPVSIQLHAESFD
jgi:hypothetical protein